MNVSVLGMAAVAVACVGYVAVASADEVNRSIKVDGPIMKIIPANAVPVHDWDGLYLGVSLGGGWGESTQTYQRAGDHGSATLSTAGGAAAMTAGYNVMMGSNLLLGLEGDLGIMNISQGATTVFDGHVWSSNVGALWSTLRGRAGYVFDNDLMAYATGGLAVANIDDTSIGNTPGESAIEDGMRVGLALGVGVEYAWDERWTLKAEYLHLNFAEADGQSANNESYSFDDNVNLVRVGANMKF